MKLKTTILSIAAAMTFTSCSDYLDKQPSVNTNTSITEVGHLKALLDNLSHAYETNYTCFYCSDDCEIPKELYDAGPSTFNSNVKYYILDKQNIESEEYDYLWQGEYKKIYCCNVVIDNIGTVSGTETEKNEVLADAHFLRAWSFYTLATYYCRPYCEANKGELGVPLRLHTTFDERLSRGTLEGTYNQIFSDLKKAEELCKTNDVNPDARWRVSQCAINAFYARLHLNMSDYSQALSYAEKALASAPALFNYNQFQPGLPLEYKDNGVMPAQTVQTCETNQWGATKFLYHSEYIFTRFQQNRSQWAIPSTALVSLYDKTNDMRFVWFFNEHGNRRMNVNHEAYRYNPINDGRYVFSGLKTSELLLTKAEAMARQGDWKEALAVLTPLQNARYKTGTAVALTAANQDEAIKVILDERRREFPFALRMNDIKRLAVNADPKDDATVSRSFYGMTGVSVDQSKDVSFSIGGNDPRLAIPVSIYDINTSHGQVEQNP